MELSGDSYLQMPFSPLVPQELVRWPNILSLFPKKVSSAAWHSMWVYQLRQGEERAAYCICYMIVFPYFWCPLHLKRRWYNSMAWEGLSVHCIHCLILLTYFRINYWEIWGERGLVFITWLAKVKVVSFGQVPRVALLTLIYFQSLAKPKSSQLTTHHKVRSGVLNYSIQSAGLFFSFIIC